MDMCLIKMLSELFWCNTYFSSSYNHTTCFSQTLAINCTFQVVFYFFQSCIKLHKTTAFQSAVITIDRKWSK